MWGNNCLTISYDKGYKKELSMLVVMKENNGKIYLINMFRGKEADELYNKLNNREYK